MAKARILGIVIYKLSHQKELSPIVLFKIVKNSKISFYSTILLLCLTINLRIENCGKLLFDISKVAKQ